MRVVIGRIGKAHGIRGDVTVEVRTDEPQNRFAIGAQLITDQGNLVVSSARVHNGILLLGFEGITDRNAVEKLRNTLLYAEVDIDQPSENEDDYHIQQLIGLTAVLENGSNYGTVADVLNLPAQDCLVIKTETGEVLIPFVRQLVPTVDLDRKLIVVNPPELS